MKTVYSYMIPVYAYLVESGLRSIKTLPEEYREPIKEYLAKNIS